MAPCNESSRGSTQIKKGLSPLLIICACNDVEVCIADGQTIILGGLRRRASQDKEEKIPFLGDIPGLGKLFGATKLRSNDTEMFIFITPKIILDAKEQLEQILYEELKKRPGDQPEFLDCLVEAQEKARYKKIKSGLKHLG